MALECYWESLGGSPLREAAGGGRWEPLGQASSKQVQGTREPHRPQTLVRQVSGVNKNKK